METINDLEELLVHHLHIFYAAEDLVLQGIPGVIEKTNHKSLKNVLQHHFYISLKQKNGGFA